MAPLAGGCDDDRVSARKQVPDAYRPRAISAADVRAWRTAGSLARIEFEPVADVRAAGAAAEQPHRDAPPPAPPEPVRAAPVPEPPLETGATMLVIPDYTLVLHDGRRIHVESNGVIGRAPQTAAGELAVAIDDPERKLSRSHLRYERDTLGRLWITDLRSGNGTEIIRRGDIRVECEPGKRYALLAGDLVLLGDATIRIDTAGEAPRP